MPTVCLNCTPLGTLGDMAACRAMMTGGLYADAKAVPTRGKPPGCTFTLVVDEQSAKSQLFGFRRATEVTSGTYPWLWVQLRFDPNHAERADLDPVLERWGLTVFEEVRLNIRFTI